MALTLQELKTRHGSATPKQTVQRKQIEERTAADRVVGGIRTAAKFVGGVPLAESIGTTLAGTRATQRKEIEESSALADQVIQAIRKNRREGKDTSRLEQALTSLQGEFGRQSQEAQKFTEDLPTNLQVAGSAARLGR